MRELEEPVKATLQELKAKHRHYLQPMPTEDGYYIFETTMKYDPEKQRNRKFSFYVGKILKDGTFIGAYRKKNSTRGVSTLDEYLSRKRIRGYTEQKELFESEYEPLVLKELSTNPRDGVAAISKRLGMPYQTTKYWIKKLEKKYGIRYTLEYQFLRNFGFERYVAVAKFYDARPDAEELKKLISDNKYVQLAVLTRGAYDLFLFLLAPNTSILESTIYSLRSEKLFAKCPATWYLSHYSQGFGFLPLRPEFFDLMKERVWRRSKEHPRKGRDEIFMREYATLKELNENGMADFSSIDTKYGLKNGSAQYTYHKLVEANMINRVTIAMANPLIKDTAIIVEEQRDIWDFNLHKKEYFTEVITDYNTPLNRYIFEGDIGSPYGIMLIAPIYKDGDIEDIEKALSKSLAGSKINTSIVSNILIGSFGYRKIDETKSWIYEELEKINKNRK